MNSATIISVADNLKKQFLASFFTAAQQVFQQKKNQIWVTKLPCKMYEHLQCFMYFIGSCLVFSKSGKHSQCPTSSLKPFALYCVIGFCPKIFFGTVRWLLLLFFYILETRSIYKKRHNYQFSSVAVVWVSLGHWNQMPSSWCPLVVAPNTPAAC